MTKGEWANIVSEVMIGLQLKEPNIETSNYYYDKFAWNANYKTMKKAVAVIASGEINTYNRWPLLTVFRAAYQDEAGQESRGKAEEIKNAVDPLTEGEAFGVFWTNRFFLWRIKGSFPVWKYTAEETDRLGEEARSIGKRIDSKELTKEKATKKLAKFVGRDIEKMHEALVKRESTSDGFQKLF